MADSKKNEAPDEEPKVVESKKQPEAEEKEEEAPKTPAFKRLPPRSSRATKPRTSHRRPVSKVETIVDPERYEKEFIRCPDAPGEHFTIFLVLDGERHRFEYWDDLCDDFGRVPQYDEDHRGGVRFVSREVLESIPEGAPYAPQ